MSDPDSSDRQMEATAVDARHEIELQGCADEFAEHLTVGVLLWEACHFGNSTDRKKHQRKKKPAFLYRKSGLISVGLRGFEPPTF